MRSSLTFIYAAAAMVGGSVASVGVANAMPIAPLTQNEASASVQKVGYYCGPGWHLNPWGRCVPNWRRHYWGGYPGWGGGYWRGGWGPGWHGGWRHGGWHGHPGWHGGWRRW